MTKQLVLCAVLSACAGGSYKGATAPAAGASADMAYEPAPMRPSAPTESVEPVPDRPGLGTSWGEQVSSSIHYTSFTRATARPWAESALYYNDAEGVDAHAAYLNRPFDIAEDGALSVTLVDDAGRELPSINAGNKTLVVGEDGERYRIIVRNTTSARFEIVTSVDGLDVMDGKPADPNRRGYLVDPHAQLVIDGFRTSQSQVAAFRFGKVSESYAAQTSGDRNVGVIGFAVFAERGARWTRHEIERRDTADPFPERGYAQPPR